MRNTVTEVWEVICLNGSRDWQLPSIHNLNGLQADPHARTINPDIRYPKTAGLKKFEIVYLHITRDAKTGQFMNASLRRHQSATKIFAFLSENEIDLNMRKLKLVTTHHPKT